MVWGKPLPGSPHSPHLTSENQKPNHGRCIEIVARHAIEPYNQGSLDGLCGLYSAINGLRLARHDHDPMNRAQCKRLLGRGAAYLHRNRSLTPALSKGMETWLWHALIRNLAKHAVTDEIAFKIERPVFSGEPDIADVFAWIDASLGQGKPVLICLRNALNHFSVVTASTPSNLLLFDSNGHRFVKRSSCGIDTGRHQIAPEALLRLSVRRRS